MKALTFGGRNGAAKSPMTSHLFTKEKAPLKGRKIQTFLFGPQSSAVSLFSFYTINIS